MRVAVAGGTGLIGTMVVDALRSRGDTAVVLARSVGVDLLTGDGLDQALAGVEAVVDVSNIVTTLSRPVAAREVASALVALTRARPQGLAPEFAGPEELHMPEMVRQLARARGVRRPVIAVRLPGEAGRAMAGGGLLPGSDGPRGTQTFAQWLSTASTPSRGAG